MYIGWDFSTFRICRHALFFVLVLFGSVSLFVSQSGCLFVCFPETPEGYQPPGFKESDGDTMMFEKEPVKLTMGEVVTPFHTLKLDMATERQRLEQVNEKKHETDGQK